MKIFVIGLILVLCSTSLVHGQKTRFGQKTETPNPADYAIKVHISASHIRNTCFEPGASIACGIDLYADAVLDGKKLELSGSAVIIQKQPVLIIPGEYFARLTEDIHNADSTAIRQQYDLLLPDDTVWHCTVTGISE